MGMAGKLVAWLTAAGLMMLVLIGVLQYVTGELAITRRQEWALTQITQRLALNLRQAVHEADPDAVRDVLLAETCNPAVSAILVRTGDRSSPLHGVARRNGELVDTDTPPQGPTIRSRTQPITLPAGDGPPTELGRVELYLDRAGAERDLLHATAINLAESAVAVALLVLVLAVVVNRSVVRPLDALRRAMIEAECTALDRAPPDTPASAPLGPMPAAFPELRQVAQCHARMVEAIGERQAALERSERTLRSIFRAAPVAMGLTTDRVLREVNDHLCEMIGTEADELVGQSARCLYPTDADFEKVGDERHDQLVAHGVGTVEARWQKRNGEVIDVLLRSALVEPGGPHRRVAFAALDITERKNAHETAQQSLRELAVLKDLATQVSSSLSLEAVVDSAIDGMASLIKPDLCMLFLRDGQNLTMLGSADHRPELANHAHVVHRVGQCLCGRAARDGQAMYSVDIHHDPRCEWDECKKAGLVSFAALPLRSGDQTIGVMGLASATRRDFSVQAAFLETAANEVAIGLQNAVFYRQLKDYADRLEREVAERRSAEEALRESETRFRALVESSSDWIWEVDAEGFCTYASPKVEDILGYKPEVIVGRQPFDVMPPEEAKRVGELFRAHAAGGQPFVRMENTACHRDGRLVVLETNGVPIRDEAGRLRGYRGVNRDITDRKQAEQALRESEAKYRSVVETSPDSIVVVDLDGRVLFANQAFARFHGLDNPEAWRGRPAMELIVPEHQARLRELHARTIEHGETHGMEITMLRKDGTHFPTEVRSMAIRTEEGEPRMLLAVARDITERKQAEEELHRTRALLEAAIEASPAGVLIADAPDVRIRVANAAALGIRGKPAGELTNIPYEMHPEHWQCFYPDGRPVPGDELPLSRAVLRGEVTQNVEVIIRRHDGEERWVLGNAAPVRDAEGRITAGVVVFPDITERKQAEQEIRRLNAELEQRVLERTAQLDAANQSLADFAYVVSHDLKAPLRGVAQIAQWLAEDYAEALGPEGREKTDLMVSRVQRMYALIDGVLAYSRIGRLEGRAESVDVEQVVRETIDLLAPPAQITISIVDALPTIIADRTRVQQVFQNLLSNAVNFMEGPRGAVRVGCTARGEAWEFFVQDDGPGIDPAYHEKVFGIFQTLGRRGRAESTGVGLALVKRIVESYGGEITLESAAGAGCTVRFTLPRAAARSSS